MIEVHANPEQALSDGAQSLLPAKFETLMGELRLVAQAVSRQL
jgi:3-deoxy-7-phosphoheptulonate synthase